MTTYRIDREVEARVWGPTWAEMKAVALWLAIDCGVHFEFDNKATFPDDAEYGLPQLIMYDHRWDRYFVRVGDYLVKLAPHRVIVWPKETFLEDFSKAAA
ncbi:hypothetical protein [Nocardia nova]|uniref:hypothetical protein n=1 Tax=Nocardia nova TaxID=37330 RepID=UPI002738DB55|nr:hypothetical protein [Nocardia nova]